MSKIKGFVMAFSVIAIVCCSLAFKPYSSGSVYCSTTCAALQKKAYRVDPVNGVTSINPCAGQTVSTPYVICGDGSCTATILGTTKFIATTDQAQ